jgi:hypothetical protein
VANLNRRNYQDSVTIRSSEDAIAEHFSFRTEYFLGIEGERIFESQDAAHAALYIVSGTKQLPVKGKRT